MDAVLQEPLFTLRQLLANAAAGPEEGPPFIRALTNGPVAIDGYTYALKNGEVDVVPDEFIELDAVQSDKTIQIATLLGQPGVVPLGTNLLLDQVGMPEAAKKALEQRGIVVKTLPKERDKAEELVRQITNKTTVFFDADSVAVDQISKWVLPGVNPTMIRIRSAQLKELTDQDLNAAETLIRAAEAAKGRILDVESVAVITYQGYRIAVLTAA